ncbi:lasso peptide biosynthesis B2 protein [Kribbella sp. NPDC058245]|uniref:lasso peptide biosynthesis B2 protein n=1 Tax=Kribbella sp. NPDC058245 TaxID=3346399 RepID=UPI0036E9C0FE
MTMQVTLEHGIPVGRWDRMLGRVCVAVAFALIRLRPARLRRVMSILRIGARPATGTDAYGARSAVVAVSVTCAGQGCLPRSVATALRCRLSGTWPNWCTGALTEPFRAHAWVEVDGQPVGELADVKQFRKLIEVPPRGGQHG